MNVEVKVIPNAKKKKIIKEDNKLKVYVISTPEKGKANKELIDVLSDYYHLPKSSFSILKGRKDRNKIIKINRVTCSEILNPHSVDNSINRVCQK